MKVLVIAYYFPPCGGAGVQRTLKFVKYLREYGWEPVVLTARNADYPVYDDSFLSEIPPGTPVYRSRIFEPYKLYRKFTGKSSTESTDISTQSQTKPGLTERISEWLRAALFIPDARIGWLFFAARMGLKIVKKEKVDILYSSAPPYTTHLIGKKIHLATGLPWLADFRDSWIEWVGTPLWRPVVSRFIEKRMEEAVLRTATRIVTVCRGVKIDLLSRHPEFDDSRWSIITNGYDPNDFQKIRKKPPNDRITFTYTGSMYGDRRPEALIRALEGLAEKGIDVESLICVRIVGRIGTPIIDRIESSRVKGCFELISYVTHEKSLEYLVNSNFCLLIIDDQPGEWGILTGKLFEYIGSGRPILAFAPEGDAAELIRTNGFGVVFDLQDVEATRAFLTSLIEGKSFPFKGESSKTKFQRQYLTLKLAEIFDEMVSVPSNQVVS